MAKRKRAQKQRPVPITYILPSGAPVEYVAKFASELPAELARLHATARQVNEILHRLKRFRHGTLVAATSIVRTCCQQAIPEDATPEEYAKEIARVNQVFDSALTLLNRMLYCRVPNLEKARFKLLYGQTSKKRELGAY